MSHSFIASENAPQSGLFIFNSKDFFYTFRCNFNYLFNDQEMLDFKNDAGFNRRFDV